MLVIKKYIDIVKGAFIMDELVSEAALLRQKETDIRLDKPWSALNKLDLIWKSSLLLNLKRNYFKLRRNRFLFIELHPGHSQKLLKKLLVVPIL